MKSVGLKIDGRWFKQLSIGILAGSMMIVALCSIVFIGGGVSFQINQSFNSSILLNSFYLFFVGAFMEELLHRGFLFQRLIDGLGFWTAQLLIATVFAVGHWTNPGMEGVGQVIGSLDLFVGSLLFGLAYYKTKSLALPVGLHLGWNWCMGNVFGFNVSGHSATGILTPQLNDMPSWFTGGNFGLESSAISVLIGIFALVIMWRWSGMNEGRALAAS
ncbi:CPBP family intramembrane metalloprotease [Alteromonas sp. ASW11-36]|uniref:CPBP family intramembrane metalloprotease n=1 Tax=Alteromonas arenosi TaxID=3055817 RepID=A0ABT7SW78_9ALTE|nr:CPBP family intramembrane glutamic endopeptidase [Alteromonas sp. ASW11-36]MDM7860400.1 CPBP family intramembrane metalloprotease [Alteromonas sp. ASW11-36]